MKKEVGPEDEITTRVETTVKGEFYVVRLQIMFLYLNYISMQTFVLYRRPPPEPGHYREKEYPDKKEKFQERFTSDRYVFMKIICISIV